MISGRDAYWGIRQASGSNAAIVLMVAVMVMQYLSFRGHASAGDVIVDGILTWDGGIYLLILCVLRADHREPAAESVGGQTGRFGGMKNRDDEIR